MDKRDYEARVARHYGMDWLRIGAFGLLILYHVGMVFVPWGFHIKNPETVSWAVFPMLAINAWRLPLLFLVSGYASRALLGRTPDAGAFAWGRTLRLVVPLAFAVALVVPPQPWVELVVRHGYPSSYWHFLTHDYFRFGRLGPLDLPTWNHMWFVAYLWVYTLLLALAVALFRHLPWQAWFDRAFSGAGLLIWPMLWLVAVRVLFLPSATETHALFGDWVAHAVYLPALLFGFGLAGSGPAMSAISRRWPVALAMATVGYAAVAAIVSAWPGEVAAPRWVGRAFWTAHALQQWGAVVALIGIADRWWNHESPIRPVLTEAVFPFYIVHQTIIVVAMFWLLGTRLPTWGNFVALVVVTVAGCVAFYLAGRGIGPLRPLIGLRRRAAVHHRKVGSSARKGSGLVR